MDTIKKLLTTDDATFEAKINRVKASDKRPGNNSVRTRRSKLNKQKIEEHSTSLVYEQIVRHLI